MNPHDFAQKKDGWCGVAALSFALHQQGVEVSQEDLAKETRIDEKGIDPEPLEKIAQNHGMKTEVLEGGNPEKTLALLDNYRQQGWSIILDYLAGNNIRQDGHYVDLLEVNPHVLRIFNPSGGKEEVRDRESFIAHWRDMKEDGKKFRYYALIMKKISRD